MQSEIKPLYFYSDFAGRNHTQKIYIKFCNKKYILKQFSKRYILYIYTETKKDIKMQNLTSKPKTITIDTRCRECYGINVKVQETAETQHSNAVFWNYMMNVSMQNTLVQMAKRA